MPALFSYLIAVALLLGGGYGALNWLATPEPVEVAKAKTNLAPMPHYGDDTGTDPAPLLAPRIRLAGAAKREPTAQAQAPANVEDQVETVSNGKGIDDKAALGDRPPSLPSPPPQQRAAVVQKDAKTEGSPADPDVRQPAEKPMAEANRDPSTDPRHERSQPVEAMPRTSQTVASIGPAAAKTTKRPDVQPSSRHAEKRQLEVMTLRTVELPDGRRITQLIPYRGGDRVRGYSNHQYRDDGPLAFGPDD